MKVTQQAPACTDAPPQITVVPQLRAPNLDVARFEPTATEPVSVDQWDGHHANRAFSEPVGGAA